MEKQKVKVSIGGREYLLATDEHDTELIEAAQMVDALLGEGISKAPALKELKATVLASLQLASDLLKMRNRLKESEERVSRLINLLDDGSYIMNNDSQRSG